MNLARQIELYLLARGTWVPAEEICRHFGITARQLRASGDRDGLLDDFAISSTGKQHGFIHIAHCPVDVYLQAKRRLRKHSIRQLRKTKKWELARARCRRGLPPVQCDLTGQLVLI